MNIAESNVENVMVGECQRVKVLRLFELPGVLFWYLAVFPFYLFEIVVERFKVVRI